MSARALWPSAATTVAGIIGDPVAHSLTPLLHNAAFSAMGRDWITVGFTVREGETRAAIDAMRVLGLGGLSVTMPHKSAVADLVDERSEVAELLGAVNSVFWRDGRLIGDNTDGRGFLDALARGAGFSAEGRRCMVLGAGGAARAVVAALGAEAAAEVVVVNRTAPRAHAVAALAGAAGRTGASAEAGAMDLVVNATSAGMADSVAAQDRPPVDPELLHRGQVVCDLIYHPLETHWLAAARESGATTVGGLGMLVHQAALAISSWTGQEAPLEAMWSAALDALS